MATDRTGTWSKGESVLWYSPTTSLDNIWSYGENAFLDELEAGPSGPSFKTWHGIVKASVKTINSVSITSIKTINGLT